MNAIATVLVAIDGSPDAARALGVAAALGAATGATLVVGHAVGLLEEQSVHGVGVDDRLAEVERQVEDWCAPLRASSTPHRIEVVPGSPVPSLLAMAARIRADVIVVATRGAGATGGLGSTSHGLVSESRVPVLVVPAP